MRPGTPADKTADPCTSKSSLPAASSARRKARLACSSTTDGLPVGGGSVKRVNPSDPGRPQPKQAPSSGSPDPTTTLKAISLDHRGWASAHPWALQAGSPLEVCGSHRVARSPWQPHGRCLPLAPPPL